MNLKKILLPLFIICCMQGVAGQSLLSMHGLDLKKSRDYHEILAAAEAKSRGLTIFATDKNTLTALQYNRVITYTDSLATTRPDDDYDFMAGYSYSNGQPSVYWASNDYKKIQELHFDFESRAVTDYTFDMPFTGEKILSAFSENNSFYILAHPLASDKLKLYIFNEGKYLQRTLDFSGYKFKDEENKPTTLTTLLKDYPLQKVATTSFNPLPAVGGAIKLYVTPKNIVLTFNHNETYTQLFTIDIATYAITENVIAQLFLSEGTTNSFYYKEKLYQLALNEDELALSVTNPVTGEVLQSHRAGKDDTITFKNSPLLEQTGNKRPNEFKNTKKFLRRAASGTAALSVYQTPNDLMVVAGSLRSVMSAEDAIIGVALTGVIVAGGGGDLFNLYDPQNTQSIYFESLFDRDFIHKPVPQQRLAIDHISQFINANKSVSLEAIIPFDYYYLLGFYDAKAKQYVLFRFEDDFVR